MASFYRAASLRNPMPDLETANRGALVRLQVAMSALQAMLWATAPENADDAELLTKARADAQAAIEIALGGRHDVPARLMRDWTDAAMKRNASRVLAASA